jgi:cell wall-associated NlpC family hydrolase
MRWITCPLTFVAALAAAPTLATESASPPKPSAAVSELPPARGDDLVFRALSHIGARYKRGGASPETGFDCSGFVRHVVKDVLGVALPRSAREISRTGEAVQAVDLKPGDLVFYNTLRRAFSHVGIYLGEHRFVHAPATGGEVRVEDMRQAYWLKRFNGARRLITQ